MAPLAEDHRTPTKKPHTSADDASSRSSHNSHAMIALFTTTDHRSSREPCVLPTSLVWKFMRLLFAWRKSPLQIHNKAHHSTRTLYIWLCCVPIYNYTAIKRRSSVPSRRLSYPKQKYDWLLTTINSGNLDI